MSGGGGSSNTTNVTNTGLGDDQYNALSGQMGNMEQANWDRYGSVQGNINASRDQMNAGFANTGAQIEGVNQNVIGLGNVVDAGFGQTLGSINNLGGQMFSEFDSLGNRVDLRSAELGNQVDMRSAELGNQITSTGQNLATNMNQGFGNLGNMVGTGFTNVVNNQNQGFADTREAINTGVSNLGSEMGARFDAQGNQISTGFQDTANRLDSVQSNVLGGQANLRTLMEQYGGNLDRYYADLARGQADQQQRLGGLQTGLDSFRNDYGRDTQLATQQRARIADSVAGGFNAVRNDIGNQSNEIQQANNQLASQVTGLGADVNQMNNQTQTSFAGVARDLAMGFQASDQQSAQMQADFANRLNTIRNLVNDTSLQIDDGLRRQYSDLSQSFDAQGRLISRSVDDNGFQVARALDSQGRLLLAQFDQNGNRVNQQSLDIDQMMRGLDQLGYQPPQNQGMASPFFMTAS